MCKKNKKRRSSCTGKVIAAESMIIIVLMGAMWCMCKDKMTSVMSKIKKGARDCADDCCQTYEDIKNELCE